MSRPKRRSKRRCSRLAVLRMNGMKLANESPEYQDDEDAVMAAVQSNGMALAHASERIRSGEDETTRNIVRQALIQAPNAASFVPDKVLQNKTFVESILDRNKNFLEFAPAYIRDDKALVLELLNDFGYFFQFVSERLRNDYDVVLKAVQNGPSSCLKHVSRDLLLERRDLVLQAVARYGTALSFAPEEFQADREVVLAAIRSKWQFGKVLRFAAPEHRADRECVLAAIKRDGRAWFDASEELSQDRSVVLHALRNDKTAGVAQAIFEQSDERRDDREMVLAAVSACGISLQWAGPTFRNDREIVLAAVETGCSCYEGEFLDTAEDLCVLGMASEELRSDPLLLAKALEEIHRVLEGEEAESWIEFVWGFVSGHHGRKLRHRLKFLANFVLLNRKEGETANDTCGSTPFLDVLERQTIETVWLIGQVHCANTPLPDSAQQAIVQFLWSDEFCGLSYMRKCGQMIDNLARCNETSFVEELRTFLSSTSHPEEAENENGVPEEQGEVREEDAGLGIFDDSDSDEQDNDVDDENGVVEEQRVAGEGNAGLGLFDDSDDDDDEC